MTAQVQHGNFLNAKQKAVKQKVMEELLDVLHNNIAENSQIFDAQTCGDMVFSCLVMFAREILIKMILSSGDLNNTKQIMSEFTGLLIAEVSIKISDAMVHSKEETH